MDKEYDAPRPVGEPGKDKDTEKEKAWENFDKSLDKMLGKKKGDGSNRAKKK